jgi:hypothetical protein
MDAYEGLLKIRAEIEAAITAGPNEADTRLKVLDRIPRQGLGVASLRVVSLRVVRVGPIVLLSS